MKILEGILKEAGEILKEGFYGSFKTTHKGKADLVTEYDLKVEEFLIPKLREAYPEFEIVGEESYKKSRYPECGIFIDPIDGTTNFVHRLPFVAISVGVWKDGEAIIGGVYNPILDEMFLAKKGEGAYLNGSKISVSQTLTMQDSLIATGFPYTKNSSPIDLGFVLNSMTNLLPKCRDMRRLGSASLDLCYVASGHFDGFYEINLKPWDVAAGALIVEEAGGRVSDIEGGRYTFEDRVIIASNGKIQTLLLNEVTYN